MLEKPSAPKKDSTVPPLRYKKLGYVALNVTNLERALAFHQDTLGLYRNRLVTEPGPALMHSRNSWCDVALYEGAAPGLRRIAFEVEAPEQLAIARTHLEALGIAMTDVPAESLHMFAQHEALRFNEPRTGLKIELFAGADASVPAHDGGIETHISQIGHAVVYVTDAPALIAFFVEHLNFRVSDFVGDAAFLRCFPNPFHHSFAIVPGSENRLNHIDFLVDDLDDVGRALYRLKRQDVPIVFGPGRHPPSGSVFLYFTDPDGFTFEFSTGMEEFPEVAPRAPRHLPREPDSLDYWGSVQAPAYGKVGRFVVSE
jgi:2,3-dihydroxy-p-cumate/2,3-dihydroxybenzoate 3,4-dioxygenase